MPKKILIVDNDIVVLSGLHRILEMKGYSVQTSLSGDILQKELPFKPDLILLDKQLPEMDGAEICKSLKKNSSTGNIPVISIHL